MVPSPSIKDHLIEYPIPDPCFELLIRVLQEMTKNMKTIVIFLDCLPEVEAKSLLLQIQNQKTLSWDVT